MDISKAIEKIKKCMALGSSSNANEAAAAMRQAQKLMESFGLTKDDIEGSSYGNEAVECPIQVNKKTPVHLQRFVGLIMGAFQVKAVVESNVRISDASYRIRYFGPAHRVTTAAYAHVVIFRAMEKAWRDYLAENPHFKGIRGARLSFMVGWLAEIRSKVEDIGWPASEKEITEKKLAEFYGKELEPAKPRVANIYGGVAQAGRSAAADFEINRPMGGSSQAKLAQF